MDEFGPLNLLPRKGKAWRQQARPKRLREIRHRYDGSCTSHAEQNAAIGACIRWHNTRAEPKTGFATDSRTRYPAKAA